MVIAAVSLAAATRQQSRLTRGCGVYFMLHSPLSTEKLSLEVAPTTLAQHFYSTRNARIANAVLATAILSVRLSVCPSVCHTPVLCQNDGT